MASEFDYRPAEPSAAEPAAGFISRHNFEFVELMNIDAGSGIDTNGVVFSDGISCVFNEIQSPGLTPDRFPTEVTGSKFSMSREILLKSSLTTI